MRKEARLFREQALQNNISATERLYNEPLQRDILAQVLKVGSYDASLSSEASVSFALTSRFIEKPKQNATLEQRAKDHMDRVQSQREKK